MNTKAPKKKGKRLENIRTKINAQNKRSNQES